MDADLTHLTAAEEIFAAECLKAAISKDTHNQIDLIGNWIAEELAGRLKAELTRYAEVGNREVSKYRAGLSQERALVAERYDAFLTAKGEADRLFKAFTGRDRSKGGETAPDTEEVLDKATSLEQARKDKALAVICKELNTRRNNNFGAAYAEYTVLKGKLERLPKDDPERATAEATLARLRPAVAEWDSLTKQIRAMRAELEEKRAAWMAAEEKLLAEFGRGSYHGPYETLTTIGGNLKQKLESLDNAIAALSAKDFTLAGNKEDIAAFANAFQAEAKKSIPGEIINAITKHYPTLQQNGPLAISKEESGRLVDSLMMKLVDALKNFNAIPRIAKDKAMTTLQLPDGGQIPCLDIAGLKPTEFAKMANGFVAKETTRLVGQWKADSQRRAEPPTGYGNKNKSDDGGKANKQSWTYQEEQNVKRVPNNLLQAAVREIRGTLAADSYTGAFLAAFRANAKDKNHLAAFPDAEAKREIGQALQAGAAKLTFPGTGADWIDPVEDAAYRDIGGDGVVSRSDKELFKNMAAAYICAPAFDKAASKLKDEAKRVEREASTAVSLGDNYAKAIVEQWKAVAGLAHVISNKCQNQINSRRFQKLREALAPTRRASVVAALLRTARIARRLANDWLEQRIRFLTKGTPPATGDAKCNQPLAPFRRGC